MCRNIEFYVHHHSSEIKLMPSVTLIDLKNLIFSLHSRKKEKGRLK